MNANDINALLRRQCEGFNVLEDDARNAGAAEALACITNLNACGDGVYRVVVCNEYRDYETGYIESWDFKLVRIEQ